MSEVSVVARACAMLGRSRLARTLEACAPALRRQSARDELLACVKLASAARPWCPELAGIVLAMYAMAGIDAGSAQHAVETAGASLRYTDRLASVRSLWLVTGQHVDGDAQLALDWLARTLARFSPDMRLVVVLSAYRKSGVEASSAPYAVAERMRAVMNVPSEITSSAVRASFAFGSTRVVVVREFAQTAPGDDPEGSLERVNAPIRAAYEEERGEPRVAVLLAPLSHYTLSTLLDARVVFSLAECEGAGTPPDMWPSFTGGAALRAHRAPCADVAGALEGRARAWVVLAPEATTPDALLDDPAIRVAVMEHAWRDAAEYWVPREPTECRAAVRRCSRGASACLGLDARRELVRDVLCFVRRERRPPAGADWHADLAAAAARLAIALAHNALLLLGDVGEVHRAQPALAVLLAHDDAADSLLRCAFAALGGVPVSPALAEVCAEAEASDAGELLCVLYALFRARMQTVRDAEAALGWGRATTFAVHTEVRPCASGSFGSSVYVDHSVAL